MGSPLHLLEILYLLKPLLPEAFHRLILVLGVQKEFTLAVEDWIFIKIITASSYFQSVPFYFLFLQ